MSALFIYTCKIVGITVARFMVLPAKGATLDLGGMGDGKHHCFLENWM